MAPSSAPLFGPDPHRPAVVVIEDVTGLDVPGIAGAVDVPGDLAEAGSRLGRWLPGRLPRPGGIIMGVALLGPDAQSAAPLADSFAATVAGEAAPALVVDLTEGSGGRLGLTDVGARTAPLEDIAERDPHHPVVRLGPGTAPRDVLPALAKVKARVQADDGTLIAALPSPGRDLTASAVAILGQVVLVLRSGTLEESDLRHALRVLGDPPDVYVAILARAGTAAARDPEITGQDVDADEDLFDRGGDRETTPVDGEREIGHGGWSRRDDLPPIESVSSDDLWSREEEAQRQEDERPAHDTDGLELGGLGASLWARPDEHRPGGG